MKTARWLLSGCALIAIGTITPSYLRVYRVAGSSDAPSFLVGDRILVNRAAYDIRLPYTDVVVLSHSQPRRGDVVVFRPPGQDLAVFKRVIGCPGDSVVVRGGRLEVNGVPLRYRPVAATAYGPVAKRDNLGALIEVEAGNGPSHLITHTPDSAAGEAIAAARVLEDHYYVIGDNRENSLDSRAYGAVHRVSILGRVVRAFRSRR